MDPVAIAELWKLGPVVALLLGAVWYFHKRDQRNDERAELRHKACEERNVALGLRIEHLEDHLTGRYAELAERGFSGLAAATAAIRRTLGDSPTPPEQMPTIHIPSDRHR